MSFSQEAKDQLMRVTMTGDEVLNAELTGALMTAGALAWRGQRRFSMTLTNENAAVTRYVYALMRRCVPDVKPQLISVRSSQLGDHVRYGFELSEAETARVLTALGLWDERAPLGVRRAPDEALMRRDEVRLGYLRGAFLACGYVSDPDRSYGMEFAFSAPSDAGYVSGLLNEMGLKCGTSERKSQYVAYLRDFESVSRLLALLGAHAAYMNYENARIMKDLRGSVNRQTNCDDSNTDKTVRAAQKQLDDIGELVERGLFDALPQPLKDIAHMRLLNPDANLTELGLLLDPPLGKSGVNNRLRRLSAMAEDAREKDIGNTLIKG